MVKFSVLIIALATVLHAIPSDTCNQKMWVTDGPVHAITFSGNKVYLGGLFTHVGPYTGGGVPIDSSTGTPVAAFPKINGTIHAACADGNGGWFVGGNFTSVDGLTRNNIAHILSNSSLDPAWHPDANNSVIALAVSGVTVYAGGDFTSIGGQSRNHIAALDATTGNALAWNPDADSAWDPNWSISVYSLAVSGSKVYTGGNFASIGGQTRSNIAALDATTGKATVWNPIVNNRVSTIAVSGPTVYVGGFFTSIGGQSRNYVGALDTTAGNVTSWDPNPDGFVTSLVASGATVYAGGTFGNIGGQSRVYIAALDATNGNATAWNPNANDFVNTIAVSGTTVYAGGYFTSIGGQNRNYVASLDVKTGIALPWSPDPTPQPWSYGSLVNCLAISGTSVYVGGQFTSMGGLIRNYIAALDATTGRGLDWNPNANSKVGILVASGTTVYAGGDFDSIGGQNRNHIAALDATTGNASAWNPNASGNVATLAVSNGSTVYAGGYIASIGGQSRNKIAALDATSGNATPWNPNPTDSTILCIPISHPPTCAAESPQVLSLAVSGTTVYAGGVFTGIGGQSCKNIAALDAATGNALAWNPNANNYIFSLAVNGSTVYAGGMFTSIGSQNRDYIAALDATTGNATAWNPNGNGEVHSLAVSGKTVYTGGIFTGIGGQSRSNIAALDAATGNALAWNPNASLPGPSGLPETPAVNVLAVNGSTIYVGGGFTNIGKGIGHPYFARFDSSSNSSVIQPISSSTAAKNTGLQIIGSHSGSGAFVKFTYLLPKAENVSLRLYSLNGQLESELVNNRQDAGNYSLTVKKGALAAGVYLVAFKAGEYHQEKLITLMK